jgi:hypothetical protein
MKSLLQRADAAEFTFSCAHAVTAAEGIGPAVIDLDDATRVSRLNENGRPILRHRALPEDRYG